MGYNRYIYIMNFLDKNGSLSVSITEEITAEENEINHEKLDDLQKKLSLIHEVMPNRFFNVTSSTAGAGSGEFNLYRQSRQREKDRWKRIDEFERKIKENNEFKENRK